jgi:hypothetical protein
MDRNILTDSSGYPVAAGVHESYAACGNNARCYSSTETMINRQGSIIQDRPGDNLLLADYRSKWSPLTFFTAYRMDREEKVVFANCLWYKNTF